MTTQGIGHKVNTADATDAASVNDARNRRWWIAALVLFGIGLALSAELVRLHFEAAFNPAYHSYCSIDDTVSCDAVTRSRFSVFLRVPLAIWGVYGYAIMGGVAVAGLRRRSAEFAALLGGLTAFAALASLLLAAISHFAIHAWCLLCIGTYVVNLAATFVAYRLLITQGARASYRALLEQCKDRRRTTLVMGLTGGAALALVLLFPATNSSAALVGPQPKGSASPPEGTVDPKPDVPSIPPLPPGVRIEQGETSDGLPWIGAANPVVTITEFFDYECSHCQQAYRGLHELLQLNPDRLRIVVRHYPLNPSCNRFISRPIYEYSCSYAKFANCAREQHRFWDAHEYFFSHSGPIEPKTFASDLKLDPKALKACLGRTDEALNRDIEAGIQLELHGTPAFVVDGKVYLQHLPRSVVQRLRLP